MSKYDRLGGLLREQPAGVRELRMSMDEIDDVLGTPLPPTARVDRPWWANTLQSNHARHWLDAGWRAGRVDLAEGIVTFVRAEDGAGGSGLVTRPKKGAYRKLQEFLESVPANKAQVAMTFADLERVMGRPLSRTAKTDRTWWANTNSRSQTNEWVMAGWRVEQVYLPAGLIVFRRPGSDPLKAARRLVRALLDPSHHAGVPGAKQLAQWIRLCKLVGWYFEGTVLYEKAGATLDGLPEGEAEAVQEDYQTCKRELTRHD